MPPEFRACVLNAYPRIGDAPEEQGLRRATSRHDTGEVSDEDLAKAQGLAAEGAIREQEAAGLDVVTDGQVSWHDPVSHLARGLGGFEINGLLRWFDTNVYIRQPVAVGPIARRGPIVAPAVEAAKRVAQRPVKAIVTGPWTLAHHTKLGNGGDEEALARSLIPPLADEVRALAAAGADYIQVDEPSLARSQAVPGIVSESLTAFASAKGTARLGLAVYFGGVPAVLPELLRLPLDFLALDLVQGADTVDALVGVRTTKTLMLGLVDARNTRLESPEAVARQAARFAGATGTPECFVTTSNSLEFLPRGTARRKIEVLARAARIAGGRA